MQMRHGPAEAALLRLPATPVEISLMAEGKSYVLRNEGSFALYWHGLDFPGQSNCNGRCAISWPPVVPSKNARPIEGWTIIERSDSSRQWPFRGKPVYTYAKDKPGATSGDGVGGVWHLIRL